MHFASASKWLAGSILFLLPLAFVAQVPTETPSTARPPVLLAEAFNRLMEDQGRWAYTETQHNVGPGGKEKGETLLRVDPSVTYDDQFKAIKIDGKAPDERQLKQFRGIGGRLAKNRKEAVEGDQEHHGDEIQLRFNNDLVNPDLAHATVLTEDETSVTYEVPLRREEKAGGAIFDKFQLTARVNKTRHEFEHARILQRTPMRAMLVAKISDMEINFEFNSVDPRFPATITRQTEKATIGILFIKRVVTGDSVRTEFKHVKPYDERFGVKLGPTRTIQF